MSAIGLQPVHSLQLEVMGPLEAAQREVERLQVLFSCCLDLVHACGSGLCLCSTSDISALILCMLVSLVVSVRQGPAASLYAVSGARKALLREIIEHIREGLLCMESYVMTWWGCRL